jgi:hypothetical protein
MFQFIIHWSYHSLLYSKLVALLNKAYINTVSVDSINLITKSGQNMTVVLNRNIIAVRPYIWKDKIKFMAQWTTLD